MMKRFIVAVTIVAVAILWRVSIASTQSAPLYTVYLPSVSRPSARYFAWATTWDSRIPVQMFGLDTRQERQYSCDIAETVLFAFRYPGHLYVACDEPDIHPELWKTARDYAIWYHDYTETVSRVDPTARFSPAGFSQVYSTTYALAFYAATIGLYGNPPIVNEWRFHAFLYPDGLTLWKNTVSDEATWAANHGAPMVLGSFGLPCCASGRCCSDPNQDISIEMAAMKTFIDADHRIVAAVWWSHDWMNWPHALTLSDGRLSPEGEIYTRWR